jgi:Response regulators consisting of a CheY-like receiver domain and a winged-helix DNA-binding domain
VRLGAARNDSHWAALQLRSHSAESALRRLRDGDAWGVVLSIGGSLEEAIDWLQRLRNSTCGRETVVLALCESAHSGDALRLLRAGADTTLPAEADSALVLAQLDSLRRRLLAEPEGEWLGERETLALDARRREAWVEGRPLNLQPQQFALLWCLMAHSDRVLSPAFLLAQGAIASTTGPTTLHTAIGRLRRILRTHRLDHCVQTVHGFGYRYVPPAPARSQEMVRQPQAEPRSGLTENQPTAH